MYESKAASFPRGSPCKIIVARRSSGASLSNGAMDVQLAPRYWPQEEKAL
jgi:hypothetical protein